MKTIFLILCSYISCFAVASDSTKYIVYFDFNDAQLNELNQKKLYDYYSSFDYKNYLLNKIVVVGHTDQIGSNNYNYSLSLKRANSVAEFLVSLNVSREFILPLVGNGETQLISSSIDENSRSQNRRVEIITHYQKLIPQQIIIERKKDADKAVDTMLKESPKSEKLADKLKDSLLKIGDKIELPFILFYGGLPQFLNISYPYLDELVETLQQNPIIEVEVQGHVCCTNERDGIDNSTGKKNLSSTRAQAVYDYLIGHGINKNRMRHKGYGHQFPITLERTEAERTRNRRVEIKILNK